MEKLTKNILSQVIQTRHQQSHKGTFGKVLLIAGSANFGGAAIMAATAAVYSGAGLVSVATDPSNFTSLHAQLPEAMVLNLNNFEQVFQLLPTVDVIAIGPGLETSAANSKLLTAVLNRIQEQQYLIIDASALNLIAQNKIDLTVCQAPVVLTPHVIEWQRLSGLNHPQQTFSNNQKVFSEIAPNQAALVLKGAPTHIYFNKGQIIYENTAGSPAMATGGMGDTLTGIIAGFLAQFSPWQDALLAAVFLHSYIAEQLAPTHYVVLPSMITPQIPFWMAKFAAQ